MITRKQALGGLAAGALIVITASWLWWQHRTPALPPVPQTPIVALPQGLQAPDAVIATPDLASLPHALLSLPLANKVLTEDMVDYYEHHPDRLGIEGSLRRIAYEHDLTLQDRLLARLLAQPAEVAFWKSDDGRLGHWLIRMRRDALSSALSWLAKVALSDSQLKAEGEIKVGNSTEPIYRLEYGAGESLLLVSHGPQLLVMSDDALLNGDRLGDSADWAPLLGKMLTDHSANPLLQSFGVQASAQGNTLAVSTRYLSFGYQQLFSTVRALRADFSAEAWSTHVLLDGKHAWDAKPLFDAAPSKAALCLSAPVEWARLAPSSKAAGIEAGWLTQLDPTAAICWYPDASLYSPLLLARTRQPGQFAQHAQQLFDWLVATQGDNAEDAPAPSTPAAQRWQRRVAAVDGELSDAQGRYFNVSLASAGDTIVFSPSAQLVDLALQVQARKYPALSDQFDANAQLQGYSNPAALSQLLQKSVMATLPGKEQQPLLRQAAVTYLLPHVKAIGEFKPLQWRVQTGADSRQPLHWDDLLWQDAP
ncbi:DUF2138 family protein [Amantichitinum ursilacus]|uniref:DUF2138 domain-containing protein n=1 Tax=Amantichitinum ursilacus TaxID=857265 RepID=A0A0N0GPI8_9NEIS|nr:DUF2138 family protein [Amantichitinum ursilacus]KPC53743.1 hypothetical protein WG78_07865 [Amantichitinum ursilacus]